MKKSEKLEMFRRIAEDTVQSEPYKDYGYYVLPETKDGEFNSVEVISPGNGFIVTDLVLAAKTLDLHCYFRANGHQQIVLKAF